MHDLLGRSALVFNDVNHCYNAEFVTKVRERLEPRVGAVKLIPFDKHLRDGAELDFGALRRRTQLAYIDLAAWLAQGFTTAQGCDCDDVGGAPIPNRRVGRTVAAVAPGAHRSDGRRHPCRGGRGCGGADRAPDSGDCGFGRYPAG